MKYLFIAVIFLAACGNPAPKETPAKAIPAAKTAIAFKVNNDQLNAVYEHYVLLTDALVKGDVTAAKLASNAIETGAKEIAGGGTISSSAASIIGTADLEKQRSAYAALSKDFIALVKSAGVTGGKLHIDFCPMALDDQGAYWLSADKAIRNPYFGDDMLSCGEVKETIQ